MKKESRKTGNHYGEPDGKTVVSAATDDVDSILLLICFYRGYISSLAVIRLELQNGKEVVFYDEDLHDELIQRFIEATMKFEIRED